MLPILDCLCWPAWSPWAELCQPEPSLDHRVTEVRIALGSGWFSSLLRQGHPAQGCVQTAFDYLLRMVISQLLCNLFQCSLTPTVKSPVPSSRAGSPQPLPSLQHSPDLTDLPCSLLLLPAQHCAISCVRELAWSLPVSRQGRDSTPVPAATREAS